MKPSQNPWRVWANLGAQGMAERLYKAVPQAGPARIASHMDASCLLLAEFLRSKGATPSEVRSARAIMRAAYARRWEALSKQAAGSAPSP